MWGYLVKVNISKPRKNKISPKTVYVVFVRYSVDSSTYRFLIVNF